MVAPVAMDEKTVGQHLGGEKTEGGGYVASKKKDPMATFAANNPQMKDWAAKMLNPEMKERYDEVKARKAATTSSGPKVIRRANPNKPTGEE
mgnify:CR=1 FL=1